MDGRAEPQQANRPATRSSVETPRVCGVGMGVGVPCHVVVSVAFSVARAETPVAMYRTCARACPMRALATTCKNTEIGFTHQKTQRMTHVL